MSQFSYQNTVLWSGEDCPLQKDISYALLALKVFTATSYTHACPTVHTICMANKLALYEQEILILRTLSPQGHA